VENTVPIRQRRAGARALRDGLLRVALLALAMPAALCPAGQAAAAPRGGAWGRPRVIVPAPDDPRIAHLSWPKVVRAPDGTLIVALSAGRGHNVGGSGPAVSRSTDGGATFSRPHLLRYFPDDDPRYRDCGNLALGLAEDGAVVLLAMAFAGDERNTILGWRSEDSGRNWRPVDVSALASNRTGSVFGHVFPVEGRRLAVAGHYRAGSRPHARGLWIAFSDDGGRRWAAPERIAESHLVEPAVIFAAGRFVGLVRDGGSTPPYWQLTGRDGKWNLERGTVGPEKDDSRLRAPSPFVAADPDEPSRLWALQSQRTGGGPPGAIWLWKADAGKLDWRRVGLVVEFPDGDDEHVDFSYPWMAPLGEGRWFLVFYSGRRHGRAAIYGMTLRLDAGRPGEAGNAGGPS
jgi:hypothetical protein